jgi:hypothetical protein
MADPMAYLSPIFENDIFLSYARVDNSSTRPSEGWVDFFKKSLETELSKLIGRLGLVHIWMDTRNLDSNQYFDEEIKKQIGASGVFLALTSPGYLHADSYCRNELVEFYTKAQRAPQSLKVGTRSRIFNALLYKIEPERWPDEIKGIGGLTLYDTSQIESGHPSRINSEVFDLQVKELARELHKFLEECKTVTAQPEPKPPKPNAPKVFLADTADSLSDVRSCVINSLQAEGIEVFSRIPPPYAPDLHEEAASERIAQADLCVHLFNDTPGQKFIQGESGPTFLQRQAELGLEKAKSQYIWVPPKDLVDIPTIKDPAYRDLLAGLESGHRDKNRYTFQREPANAIPGEIIKRVKELRRPVPPPSLSAALLETHRKDQLLALDLYPLLLEKSLQPYINPDAVDPGEKLGTFQRLVQQISVLIIIFGSVAGDWVRERVNASLQLAATTEPRRLKLCGIYAPPDEDGVAREVTLGVFPGTVPIFVFNDCETLSQLLDDLLGGGR